MIIVTKLLFMLICIYIFLANVHLSKAITSCSYKVNLSLILNSFAVLTSSA